jgi:glutamyl-tRNA synthetase
LINYLVRLGWSHGDDEIFSRDEMVEKFDIDNVGRSASVFNPDKLNWLNAHYIKTGDPERLADLLLPHLSGRGVSTLNGPGLVDVVRALQERAQTLEEMAERAVFYYNAPVAYDEAALGKFDRAHLEKVFTVCAEKLAASQTASVAELDQLLKEICADNGWKMPQVGQPLRIALSGCTQAPGIGEIVNVLGTDEAVRRIHAARAFVAA